MLDRVLPLLSLVIAVLAFSATTAFANEPVDLVDDDPPGGLLEPGDGDDSGDSASDHSDAGDDSGLEDFLGTGDPDTTGPADSSGSGSGDPLDELGEDATERLMAALLMMTQFRFHLEVRTRLEFLSNDNGLGGDVHIGLRSRLGLTWAPTDFVNVTVQLQDVRKFGAFPPSPTGSPAGLTDLYLGYFLIRGEDFAFQMGRQELSYDSQRLVGALDWANQGRQFDAVRLRLLNRDHGYDKASLDIFWTPTGVNGAPPFGNFNAYSSQFAGVHATLPILENHKAATYAYYLNAGTPTTHTFTFGVYFSQERKGSGAIYDAEAAIQISDVENAVGTGFAYAAHAGGGYDDGSFKIYGEINIASGEDALDPAVQAFNNLFPTNHNKYGYIDRQGWSNTLNFAVRSWYRLGLLQVAEKSVTLDLELSVWMFFRLRGQGSNDAFLGALPASTSDLKAVEIDFAASMNALDLQTTLIGVSVWIPGGLAEDAGFGNVDVYFYLMIRFKI